MLFTLPYMQFSPLVSSSSFIHPAKIVKPLLYVRSWITCWDATWNQTDAAPAVKDLDVHVRPHGRKVAITVVDADPCERKDQGAVKGAREGAAYLDLDGGGKPSEE